MKNRLSLFNISKYRTEIMGYAILGVMLAHIKVNCGFIDTIPSKVFGLFCYSVFTGGFFFISGLGLYNSLYYKDNCKDFYLKRIKRLLIPYWIISAPFFLYVDIVNANDLLSFMGHITTFSIWFEGNFSGMWYIATILLYYWIFPFFYRAIYKSDTAPTVGIIIAIIIAVFIANLVRTYAPVFYGRTNGIFNNIPIFIIGSYVMYKLLMNTPHYSKEDVVLTIIWLGGAFFIEGGIWYIVNFLTIYLLGLFFNYVESGRRWRTINVLFKWLGNYTLELYVIHLLVFNLLNFVDGHFDNGMHMVIGVITALIICEPIHNTINYLVVKLK